jgi:hypothetical protein
MNPSPQHFDPDAETVEHLGLAWTLNHGQPEMVQKLVFENIRRNTFHLIRKLTSCYAKTIQDGQ